MGALGRFFAGLGIALAFLLVFGAVVTFTAVDRTLPILEQEYPTALLMDTRQCPEPCTDAETIHTFSPPEGARVLDTSFVVQMEAAGGALRLQLVDPDGGVVLDRTYTGSVQAQQASEQDTHSPTPGEWRYTLTTDGFQGQVVFEAWSRGLPEGSLR